MKTIKITRDNLMSLNENLNAATSYKDFDYAFHFSYAIVSNIKIIKDSVETITKMIQELYSDEFKKFDEERTQLAMKYATKDENNNPIVIEGRVPIKEIDKFNKEIENLTEKYKDVIDVQEKRAEEFNNFMKEEIEINIYPISKQYFPPKDSDGSLIMKLWDLIDHQIEK